MADLAIKGHPTRGKDVIQLLEMLGGVNKHQIGAIRQTYVYFIDTDGIIRLLQIDQLLPEKDIVYSLEEFEEKYPFKVGDKVTLDNKLCSIIWMCWECNNIYYQVQGIGDVFTKKVTADELKLYKERNNMGKKLAIKGHATRGKEVIQFLEMLGGTNDYFKHDGKIESFYYYIGDFNNHIYQCGLPSEMKCFELEEFLEKYPYKVGDKVVFKFIDTYVTDTIKSMEWYANGVVYTLKESGEELMAEDLQPFKEETMEEEKENFAECIEKTIQECLFGKEGATKEIKIDIPEGYEFFGIDDNNKVVLTKIQPQYPKTYEECEASGFSSNPVIVAQAQGVCLCSFAKLIVLRNAYWKIAGEQMGLGKPWEPDLVENCGEYRYCIHNQSNKIELCTINWLGKNYILSFPTAEMRDEFYNNFKELIEECKELL